MSRCLFLAGGRAQVATSPAHFCADGAIPLINSRFTIADRYDVTTRTRGYLLGAAAALIAAWSGLQFWLTHRAFELSNAQAHARAAAWNAAHPGQHLRTTYVQGSYWTHAGVEGCAAMLLIVFLAVILAAGGRRWWTLLVAALPAAVAVGRFNDGTSIGQGWNQPTEPVQTWLAAGVIVDTATLLAFGALLVVALPTRRAPAPAPSVLYRVAPPAVILVGWWLVRHPIADASDRVWLAQAVVWAVLIGFVATTAVPLGARLVALVVMPLLSFALLADLIGTNGRGFDGPRYLHHLAVAAGITAYVVAVPWLQKLLGVQAALSVS
jgi:hypothetical protein